MKHWLRFISNNNPWAIRTAFNMENLYARKERAEAELNTISQHIKIEEERIEKEANAEWSVSKVNEAMEAAEAAKNQKPNTQQPNTP
jgi:3-methyladenine DNA glycosylase AlkD